MYDHLLGDVVEKSANRAVVRCGGVGYEVRVSLNSGAELQLGATCQVFTMGVVTMLDASVVNATNRPSSLTEGHRESSLPGIPAGDALARIVDCAKPYDATGSPHRLPTLKGMPAAAPVPSSRSLYANPVPTVRLRARNGSAGTYCAERNQCGARRQA